MSSDETPKLRMAPRVSPNDLTERFNREKRALDLQREDRLEESLHPYRVGSVPYLNSAPLTRGLEDQVFFAPPAELARKLKGGELDAALLSVTEALFSREYMILDGIAVASLGEVRRVFVAHQRPMEEAGVIYCDPASLASASLLRVLLKEKGLNPELKPLESYAAPPEKEFVMLIGNPAIEFLLNHPRRPVWDLGAAWFELTGLPFVFAAWVIRRGIDHGPLCRHLREAKDFGLDTLDYIIRTREEYSPDFRRDYLGWHIHYHLGSDEKRGMAKFIELLRKNGEGPVYEPSFIE